VSNVRRFADSSVHGRQMRSRTALTPVYTDEVLVASGLWIFVLCGTDAAMTITPTTATIPQTVQLSVWLTE
jgi:hypothetical protein